MNEIKLFLDFIENANYSEKDMILIQKIIRFLSKHIRNKSCIKGLYIKNKLQKLMCQFSLLYSFELNESKIMINDIKKISSGGYGEVYRYGYFKDIPIIIKSPLEFSEKNIREIFINYVIINSLLMKYDINLVPTYGFFICNHTYIKTKNKKKLDSLCVKNDNDYPNLHLVQKCIDAKELQDILEENIISFSQFKNLLKNIFSILSFLENTRFKLYHNDLHSGNILIDKNLNPYLIDFGLSSFKVGNVYYTNSWEYTYHNKSIFTGLHDLLTILNSCKKHSKNKEIKDYCNSIMNKYIFEKLWEGNNKSLQKTSLKTKVIYLYDDLKIIESLLPKKEQEVVHYHNINILKNMTYSKILDLLN